ncbi:MAG: hypothetical protein IPM07_25490 [Anaerolineales bacterium]|nr:hypothetical protein [Anaerolineales bacterium]
MISTNQMIDESSDEFSNGRIACGTTDLPSGDSGLYEEADSYAYNVADCQGCNRWATRLRDADFSAERKAGSDGFDAFSDIAATWGYP